MANPVAIALLASAVQSADGAGTEVALTGSRRAVALTVAVTDLELVTPGVGEPVAGDADYDLTLYTVRVVVETRLSSSHPWVECSDLDVTATGQQALAAGGLEAEVRVRWEFGTNVTSITFAVDGFAHVVYIDPAHITKYAVPEHSIAEISASARAEACIAVTGEAEGYIAGAYELPLVSWDDEALRMHVSRIAAALLFSQRGCEPQGADASVFLERERAIEWLNRVANGRLKPAGIVDTTPETFEGGSVVLSAPSRGW